MGGFDIYKSVKQSNGTWGDPVNMGYPINGPDDDLFYRQTSDPNLALFTSKRSGGFGGLDVYYIRNDLRIPFVLSGNVSDVETRKTLQATVRLFDRKTNMPVGIAINDTIQHGYVLSMEDIGDFYMQADAPGYRSTTDDFINPKTRHAKLYHDFALERLLNPYSLYGTVTDERTGKPVQAEILFKLPGNDDILYRAVSDGNTGFYNITMEDKVDIDVSLRATEYFDHNDLLALKNVEDDTGVKNFSMKRSIPIYIVTGTIKDERDGRALRANVKLTKPDEDLFTHTVTDEKGNYELISKERGPFNIEVTSEGYFFADADLHFEGDSIEVIRNITLKKIEVGAKMVIGNILFNSGNANLRPESYAAMNRLVELMRENPTLKIEVSGHTDNVGSAANNKTLSNNRAITVRNYLTSQGIAADRLEYNGYGPDRPIAPNNTEEGRASNRRVEVEVLSFK